MESHLLEGSETSKRRGYQRITVGECPQYESHLAYVFKKKGSFEPADELDDTQSLHWKAFA